MSFKYKLYAYNSVAYLAEKNLETSELYYLLFFNSITKQTEQTEHKET